MFARLLLLLLPLVVVPSIVIPDGAGEPKDLNMNVRERIAYWGYPSVREYSVLTEDGYLIYVQRIQNGRFKPFNTSISKPVVFLQHGLMSSSGCWVVNLPGQSLAYMLADKGYDVWLGNVRGNTYGQRHVSLNPKGKKFWDFTWTDMALRDLPAMLNFTLQMSGQKKLAYIGHSQGTMMGFAFFSRNPDYALAHVTTFIALAPVNTVGHISSHLAKLSPYVGFIKAALTAVGDYSLGSVQWLLKFIKPVCLVDTANIVDCENVYFSVLGTDQLKHINQSRMPIIIKGFPDDTSMKNIAHFGQMVNSDKFEDYNYGGLMNLAKYKRLRTPEFDVGRISISTQLYYSTKDTLADVTDVEMNLLPRLKHITYIAKSTDFQHADYIIALSATKAVYDDLIPRIPKVE